MVAVQRDQIDVGQDGTFVITADSTPADGRRNHLHLPPQTRHIAVRDTLRDWTSQVPNEVEVRVVAGPERPARERDEIVQDGIALFQGCVDLTRDAAELHAQLPRPMTSSRSRGRCTGAWPETCSRSTGSRFRMTRRCSSP